jgi:hypothetical protein
MVVGQDCSVKPQKGIFAAGHVDMGLQGARNLLVRSRKIEYRMRRGTVGILKMGVSRNLAEGRSCLPETTQ